MNILDLVNLKNLKQLYAGADDAFKKKHYMPKYILNKGVYYSLKVNNKYLRISKYLGKCELFSLYDVLIKRNNALIKHYPYELIFSIISSEILEIIINFGPNEARLEFIKTYGSITHRSVLQMHLTSMNENSIAPKVSICNNSIRTDVFRIKDVYKVNPHAPETVKYFRYKVGKKSPEFVAEYAMLLKKYRYIELKKKYPGLIIIE